MSFLIAVLLGLIGTLIKLVSLYNENDELGVLVSYGYGAGWSTWNDKKLAYDKRIVEKFLDNNCKIALTNSGHPLSSLFDFWLFEKYKKNSIYKVSA